MSRKPTLVIDIDGVIFLGKGCYADRMPNDRVIRKLKELYSSYHIVLFTSRPVSSRKGTLKELSLNNVCYHRLIMGKPRALHYVDDKAMSPMEFLKMDVKR